MNATRRILELHNRIPHPSVLRAGEFQCEHCASLCHDRSGVGCEVGGDAVWPCDTVRALTDGDSGSGLAYVSDGPQLVRHVWTMYHHLHATHTAVDAFRWVIHPEHRNALLRLKPEENPLGFFGRTLAPDYVETIGGMPIRVDPDALVPMLELR